MSAATEFAPTVRITGARSQALALVPDSVPLAPPRPARPDRLGASISVLHRPQSPAQAAPLRLTRRGVLVLAALVGALAMALLWAGASSARSDAAAGAPARVRAVTVVPGDTLWSIASRVAPGRDPRAEVAALQHRNHLSGADLVPGQQLRVP
ncbi:LysM peptidoglycan-binding domain-containing protein [uncultured Jatrophihabitans sp.]|uniref:LysM peptidoglycan-binding domain-containing protein n=1 Tax=uncultured Jatrophihabitans sp. TaxID=1610747 RepID=UPI0035C9D162